MSLGEGYYLCGVYRNMFVYRIAKKIIEQGFAEKWNRCMPIRQPCVSPIMLTSKLLFTSMETKICNVLIYYIYCWRSKLGYSKLVTNNTIQRWAKQLRLEVLLDRKFIEYGYVSAKALKRSMSRGLQSQHRSTMWSSKTKDTTNVIKNIELENLRERTVWTWQSG